MVIDIRRRRYPFILQINPHVLGDKWVDTARFANKDEAIARMRNMPKNDAVSVRVIRDGFSEDDNVDPRLKGGTQ